MNAAFPPPKLPGAEPSPTESEPTVEERTALIEATVRRMARASAAAFEAAKKPEAKALGLGATKLEQLVRDFRKQQEEEQKEARVRARPVEPWADSLILTETGKRESCEANVATILERHPVFAGGLWYDEFASQPTWRKSPPWSRLKRGQEWQDRPVSDSDIAALTVWVQAECAVLATPAKCATAICAVADRRRFHPVKNYLEPLVWDKKPRLATWLHTYVHAEKNDYHAAVGMRWMVGAVRRIFQPGCKLDNALILEGPQDLKKSTTAEVLAGGWFADDLPDLSDKDAMIHLQGKWVIEFAEMSSFNRAEANTIKNFMSRKVDRFRPPFGRVAADHPRQVAFVGTLNPTGGYLKDPTGARRFWVVKCGGPSGRQVVDIDGLRRDRDQLWAEAVHLHTQGVPHWLETAELRALARDEQEDRYEGDAKDEGIAVWVLANATKGKDGRQSVSVPEVIEQGLGIVQKEKWTQAIQNDVAKCLTSMGWVRQRVGSRADRQWRYFAPTEPTAYAPVGHARPAPWDGTPYTDPRPACTATGCPGHIITAADGSASCGCPRDGCTQTASE